MSKRTYHPERGDLVEINLQPAVGREIDKRRPAIVISDGLYNRRSGLCIIVPTSTDLTSDTVRIPLPPGLLPKQSLVLCDYVKSLDYRERSATFLAKVPASTVDEVIATLLDLIDPVNHPT